MAYYYGTNTLCTVSCGSGSFIEGKEYTTVVILDFRSSSNQPVNVQVDLFERYELTMQLPVKFDSSPSKVAGYGEPLFHLFEVASVSRNKSGAPLVAIADQRRFGSTEWLNIVKAGGDFSGDRVRDGYESGREGFCRS